MMERIALSNTPLGSKFVHFVHFVDSLSLRQTAQLDDQSPRADSD